MFSPTIYEKRRELLRKKVGSGVIIFMGNEEAPMNYPDNPYHYRQDSSFLYFFGLSQAGLAGMIDVDGDKDILFGNDVSIIDIIWMGAKPSMVERGGLVGIEETKPRNEFESTVKAAMAQGRKVHYLPVYRADTILELCSLLGKDETQVRGGHSEELIKAVVEQRSIKIEEEIVEMEKALDVTYEMYKEAMKMTRPGLYEREIAGMMEGIALAGGGLLSFPIILTINGHILHNHYHGNKLKEGRLLIVDSGSESQMSYASDITRTFPVSGKFLPKQRDIYEIVYKAIVSTTEAIKPGVPFKDIHLAAAKIVAEGLKNVGLMKGDTDEAVRQGAHALFFPHGLGHHIGLDVHDMEGYGEDYVGYDETVERSGQFGLKYLRLAKALEENYVVTVEPGIYFIPALIDKWRAEKKFEEFINYDKTDEYRDFGGARIEDDVLVTKDGYRVLGKSIPKSVDDVEAAMK